MAGRIPQANIGPCLIDMVVDADRTARRVCCIDQMVGKTEAAIALSVSPDTLDRWERAGFGPPRIRFGAEVYFRLSVLEMWLCEGDRGPLWSPEKARTERQRPI